MLTELAEGLWETTYPFGLVRGMRARTTVIRLENGNLWVHSPGRLTPELAVALHPLGQVKYLVAPNQFHHLFMQDWRAQFPGAICFVAPRLGKKRRDLSMHPRLSDQAPPLWSDELAQHVIRGNIFIGEVVFFHRASKTLITTDLVHNVRAEPDRIARAVYKLLGGYGGLNPSRVTRFMCRDRGALRASIDRVLDWSFDRVIVGHGDVLERGGKDALRRGFSWVRGRNS